MRNCSVKAWLEETASEILVYVWGKGEAALVHIFKAYGGVEVYLHVYWTGPDQEAGQPDCCAGQQPIRNIKM